MAKSPYEILLVEDNPGDVELVQEALTVWKSPTKLSVVGDGDMAMEFLRRTGAYVDCLIPDLILLDLNLPGRDGIEVLREVKSDATLALIPLIVLTTSDSEADVRQAYNLHANSYLTKPLEIDLFIDKVRAIEQFWLKHARVPHGLRV